MTPYQLSILLHYHSCATDPDEEKIDMTAPLWRPTIADLMLEELIQLDYSAGSKRTYCLAPRGVCFVNEGLCKLPLPVKKWEMP